jgi:hypothetical protein
MKRTDCPLMRPLQIPRGDDKQADIGSE